MLFLFFDTEFPLRIAERVNNIYSPHENNFAKEEYNNLKQSKTFSHVSKVRVLILSMQGNAQL